MYLQWIECTSQILARLVITGSACITLWQGKTTVVLIHRKTSLYSSPRASPQCLLGVSIMGRSFLKGKCTVWTHAGCVSAVVGSPSAPRPSAPSLTVKTSTFLRANVAPSA